MMARRADVYMKVKHREERKLVYSGANVATRLRDSGLVRSTKATG